MKHASTTAPSELRPRSFAWTLLLGAAALTLTLAGVRSVADIVGPVLMAVVITITLHPIRVWLERGRLPGWAISTLMLASAVLLLSVFAVALMVSVAQLAALVPTYADQIADGVANVGNTLRDAGVKQEQINAVVNAFDPGQVIDVAMSVLAGTFGLVTDLFFLITVLLFVAFDTDSTRRSLKTLGDRFPEPVAALDNFAHGTRNYMGVSAGFGLIVAVIDGVALYVLDVPGAFVWAVLAFVTNFIPNIGFVIGVIPPALIALLDGGLGLMVTVIVVYCVINFVIQSIIQPRVVGDSVGLSATLTFLSLVFWTWVIGPVGALLAVPCTLLTKALLVEADPRGRWALPLISGKPDTAPGPERAAPAELQPEATPE
ncbi:Predicted PurR-regulated permease PerM [Nocardioides sp. YR527]|uniref:AI-2E family transporter n=1 Tax=Nocardioides sp. YR527 TaxID=1881028 RepID=UPI000884EE06|nr:AI-2E family transporter [Nocardioides sp. YR527]SDK27217.1 Predicted PurR-regulated permease PerM [Nocardioides sp. YR527]